MCQVRAAIFSGAEYRFLMEFRKGSIEVSNSVQFRKHKRLSNIKTHAWRKSRKIMKYMQINGKISKSNKNKNSKYKLHLLLIFLKIYFC